MVLKFDLHIHTVYSKDSFLRPEKIIKIARVRELDGIAITDHNSIKGGLITKKIAKDDIKVIIGSEIMTNNGEVIGLFLNEDIKSTIFEEVVDEINDQDGVIILPHPYRNKRGNPENLGLCVDFIESKNGRTSPKYNKLAEDLALKYNIPVVGGSDAHLSFEIGKIQTLFETFEKNEDYALRDLFKSKTNIIGQENPQEISRILMLMCKMKKKYSNLCR
ncbi:MAG: PHP domain-containing protein [Candidatus Thermoplasmatota archaeon]|nr:PHP domain-containing protein [Candidatus Thermoplasmatota archaeon]